MSPPSGTLPTVFEDETRRYESTKLLTSDGTPLASQWPIPPKHYFDYELHPLVKEAGSYFYHSHVEFQAVSAAGPLLVLEPNGKKPPIQYDDERILFTTELYNKSDSQIMNGLIGAPFVWYVDVVCKVVKDRVLTIDHGQVWRARVSTSQWPWHAGAQLDREDMRS